MPPPRLSYEPPPNSPRVLRRHRSSARGRARADAQGRCDGAGSGEIGSTEPSRTFTGAGGFFAFWLDPISMVKSRSGGLGYLHALTARRAFLMLLPFRAAHYASTVVKLQNSTGNKVRISGGKSVTHYSRACLRKSEGMLLCPEDFPDKSVGRRPSQDTGPNTRVLAAAHCRCSVPRNVDIRNRARNTATWFGLCSFTIVTPFGTGSWG